MKAQPEIANESKKNNITGEVYSDVTLLTFNMCSTCVSSCDVKMLNNNDTFLKFILKTATKNNL